MHASWGGHVPRPGVARVGCWASLSAKAQALPPKAAPQACMPLTCRGPRREGPKKDITAGGPVAGGPNEAMAQCFKDLATNLEENGGDLSWSFIQACLAAHALVMHVFA